MAQFKAFEPGVNVSGEAVLSVIEGMGKFQTLAKKILSDNGIKNPQTNKWYSQENWLKAFEEIYNKAGGSTLKIIGYKIPKNAIFPTDVDSIEKALFSINIAYHMNHKGGEIGSYKFEKNDNNSGLFICNNPYPCDFDEGIILATAKKFQLENKFLTVEHLPGSCRNLGDDVCKYIIEW